MISPFIFDIKKYALNDGPGIRLTIFFKGCPLNCLWCHNPESHSVFKQKIYIKSKCIGAKECINACPNKAIKLTENGIVTDWKLCTLCGKCADVCPTKAIEILGVKYSIEELLHIIEKEKIFFEQSEGGVTISGGEPLMFPEFLCYLLEKCKNMGIHTAVDTSGYADSVVIKRVAEVTDIFLFDIKLMDPIRHKKWTGVDNKQILENFEWLVQNKKRVNVRIPIIKGVNADIDNLESIAGFLNQLNGEKFMVNLLPFHSIAKVKYQKMGMAKKYQEFKVPSQKDLKTAIDIFKRYNITAEIGG